MGRVPIATEHRTGEGGDRFPQVKLTEKDQKARFTVIEKPWREFVHWIKAPAFDDEGLVVRETKTKKDGSSFQDIKLDFISNPICLGDETTLLQSGLDPKNCPACDAAQRSNGDIAGPVQRFSVNVIEYTLRGSSWDIKTPFSAEIKVWVFNGRTYDEIEGIQQEIGDLRHHDLTLVCEDPWWKRNKLAFKMEPGYKHESVPPGYIKQLLTTEGNRATESQLRDACGRDLSRTRMQEDCEMALRAFRKLQNEGSDAPAAANGHADLNTGIDDLLGDETPAKPAAPAAAATEDPLGEFTKEGTANPDRTERERREDEAFSAGQAAAAPPAASSGDLVFDDLLEGLA